MIKKYANFLFTDGTIKNKNIFKNTFQKEIAIYPNFLLLLFKINTNFGIK